MDLEQAVQEFARQACAFSEADLEKPWTWRDYDEGVRHAIFRTYEQLRELAARLETARQASSQPLTTAQRLMTIYHAGHRDLEAILLACDDALGARPPGEGEWSINQALSHMIQAERSFFAITHYALQRARAQVDLPLEMSEDDFTAFWAGDGFSQLRATGSFKELMAYYQKMHSRILLELSTASEAELQAPSVFWESEPYPVQYRLLRFDSHQRQHTVQIEKSLQQLDAGPGEAQRLMRLVYSAYAGVEGACLGLDPAGLELFEQQARHELAGEIAQRTGELAAAVSG